MVDKIVSNIREKDFQNCVQKTEVGIQKNCVSQNDIIIIIHLICQIHITVVKPPCIDYCYESIYL